MSEKQINNNDEQTDLDEAAFNQLLGGQLGEHEDRALGILHNYGHVLSGDVLDALLHARDKDLVKEVLDKLSEHYDEHLQYQHPEIQGQISNSLGVNETERFFVDLFENTLGLTRNPET